MKIFLDTNVLIDFMGERPAYYMQAATIFSLGIDHRCEVAVSALSMVTAIIYAVRGARCHRQTGDGK